MTERERWIVYPLLFLALGAALRDKLFDRTTSKSIVCQELTVVDAEPYGNRPVRILARIGRTDPNPGQPTAGYLIVNGQLDVQGTLNARQYAYQGVPFVPAGLTLPLGIPLQDFLLRAMQQAQQSQQQRASEPEPPPVPAGETPSSPAPTPTTSTEPLADPAESR